jgi:BirA family biotin operon repressor/biotin-[acetyl-CoA-carboxylase] ligase
MKKKGIVSNMDVSNRDERIQPLVYGTIYCGLGFILLRYFNAPALIQGLMFCYAFNTAIVWQITKKWKISIHAIGLSGPLVALWIHGFHFPIIMGIALVLLCVSRTNLRTKEFGKEIEYYQRLDSTNNEAWELINNGETQHGMIVITDYQFKGKGRSGNSWFMSPSKGIAMSLILQKPLPFNLAGLIPLVAGVAMARTLKNRNFNPKLKWPNDILLNQKKVGGILCESKISKKSVNTMVVGIGLNVNETRNDFPENLIKTASSLSIESKHPHQRELIVAIFATYFEQCIELVQHSPQELITEWETFCGHLNQTITFKFDGNSLSGLFKGVNNLGQAVIIIDGNEQVFPSIILD